MPPGWDQSYIVVKPGNRWYYGENLDSIEPKEIIQLASMDEDAFDNCTAYVL